LVFYDQIYRSTDGGATFEIAFSPGDHELAAPFDMGIAVGSDDTVYYGEYIATRGVPTNRVRVVLGSDDGTSWDIVYTFALGEIRHIHSITYDSFRDRYWVCTGDVDAASRLLYTDDNFNTLHELGGGSQDWRIVSLIVTPDFLYWGSDNSQTGAAIFRWSFANEKLEKLQDIGNVSYYSTILKNGTLVVSTTYEPDSLYTKLFNPQATADIWVSRSGIEWTKIVSLPHELRHGKSGPSRAQIAFPSGGPSELLYYTPYATREHEFTVQVLRPE